MARRSLQASTLGIEKAKRAFKRTEWTQEDLACEIGIETRQPIWKFFTGKPIERQTFLEICFRLDLDWQDIAARPSASLSEVPEKQDNNSHIDTLVQKVRSHRCNKVQAKCGTIRLLDTAQPIELEDVYVSIDIVENITSQRWLDIAELQRSNEVCSCMGLSQVDRERVPAMQAAAKYPKLMVLGKPGSGKTALLQHIAIKCNRGEFLADRIPIFIRLKNFAEDASESANFSLLSYISQELGRSNILEQQVETLLSNGKVLILLDGLDELQEKDRDEVQKQIRKLSEEYDKNQIIITCRVAAQQYGFEEFTNIEIADFNSSQIEAFAQKWFASVAKNSNSKTGKALAEQFILKLQLSENRQICELAKTPLLLHLACSVFRSKSDFPVKHSDIYRQALEILLVRWDETKGIKQERIHNQLSLPQKLKLLSQIANITFEQGHYYFPQSNVQQYIVNYLRSLPNAQTDPEELQLSSEAVLKSISVQHGLLVEQARGIYSFSHLTFQEYLTARNIVASFQPQVLNKNLTQLTSHISETRWREVFLLTAGMLENADVLMELMQQHSSQLMAADPKLQQFLVWLHHKSLSIQAPYKPAAISAFYLTLDLSGDLKLARNLSLALAIDLSLASNFAPDLAIDLALNRALSLSLALPSEPSLEQILAISFALPNDRTLAYDPNLQRSLQQLKEQLPAFDQGGESLKEWWEANGQAWIEQLKSLTLRCRNIGHQWQFSKQQQEILQQYYAAKNLLIDCLQNGCEVSSTVREKIEDTLLLPMSEIGSRSSGFLL